MRVAVALFAFTRAAIAATGTAVPRVVGLRGERVSDGPGVDIDVLLRVVMTTVMPSESAALVVVAAWGITVPRI